MKKVFWFVALLISANVHAAIINLSVSDAVINVGESTTITVSLVTETDDMFDFITLDFLFDTSLAAFDVGSESFFGVISAVDDLVLIEDLDPIFGEGVTFSYLDATFDVIDSSVDLFSFDLTAFTTGTVDISMDDLLLSGSGYYDMQLDDNVFIDFSELNGTTFNIVEAEVSAPATGALFLASALLLAGLRRKVNV